MRNYKIKSKIKQVINMPLENQKILLKMIEKKDYNFIRWSVKEGIVDSVWCGLCV